MSNRDLDETWTNWLSENLERNCPPQELLGILLNNDFTVNSIRLAMGNHSPENSPLLGSDGISIDYEGIANVAIDGGIRIPTDKLQLYMIPEFLDRVECDELVSVSALNLRPSTTTTGERDQGYRTSKPVN